MGGALVDGVTLFLGHVCLGTSLKSKIYKMASSQWCYVISGEMQK